MTRFQQFRKWMYNNAEEYGRSTSEYDYKSYSKGWDHAIQEVRKLIEREDMYCNATCKYLLDKELDKL